MAAADLVLDCTDNFTTRHAINRACVEHRKPLVSGAAIRFDGQVSVYDLRDDKAPCYHCLFPEADDVEQANCATMGVFAPVVGIIGSMQAAEALKLLSGVGESLSGRLQWLDVRTMQWRSVNAARPGMSGLRTPARLKIHAVPYRLQPVSPACYWPCGQCMD